MSQRSRKAEPTEFCARILGSHDAIRVQRGQTLLDAALAAGVAYPHNCRVGSCTECKTRLVEGEVTPLSDWSYVLRREDIETGFILACQSVPKSDLVVEVDVKFVG